METDARIELALVALSVGLVACLGVALGGVGFANGDAAAYLAQAAVGDLGQRTVHLGYVALAAALAERVDDLPRALDTLSTAACVLTVVMASVAAHRCESRQGVAALAVAAVMLPLAAHAEVDALWIAAIVASRALPAPAGAACFCGAVTVSPVALLALPWAAWDDRTRVRWLVGGAVVAVLGLTWFSEGAWWTGDRGVLTSPLPRPARAVRVWATALPWALLPLALVSDKRGGLEVLTWVPLLLAPPDVPVWALPAISLALRGARGALLVPNGVTGMALALQLGISGFTAWEIRERVREEAAVVRLTAERLAEGGALVAPFTWGARVSVVATGDPYGVVWRPPDAFLRDQRDAWCAHRGRVLRLPPVDGAAVVVSADDPVRRAGCEP